MQTRPRFRKIRLARAAKQTPRNEEAHHKPNTGRSFLDFFFTPKSDAVIGATDREGTIGRTVVANLIQGKFRGKVYAVNPNHQEVLGIPCYPKVSSVPDKVDLAVIVTPASSVPGVVGECVDAGVRSAVVISAGFRESGPEGAELELQIMDQLRRGTMSLVGPN